MWGCLEFSDGIREGDYGHGVGGPVGGVDQVQHAPEGIRALRHHFEEHVVVTADVVPLHYPEKLT